MIISGNEQSNQEESVNDEGFNAMREEKTQNDLINSKEDSNPKGTFDCKKCGKVYISIGGLNYHCKTKHKQVPKKKRKKEEKRGRPLKYIYSDDFPKEQIYFFNDKIRRPLAKNPTNIALAIPSALDMINKLGQDSKNHLIDLLNNYKPLTMKLEDRMADDVFYEYLMCIRHLTNQTYFDLIVKVILLLREYYNKKNEDPFYSTNHHIKDFPLIVNDLVENFLEKHNYFGLSKERNEVIEIIINFILWINNNDYSPYIIGKAKLPI